MSKVVNFAIVGCGRVSLMHINGIIDAPSARLAAVCDIDEKKAKETAEYCGLTKWYTDADEMFKNEKIDVCCVLVPSGLHHTIAIKAAGYGINVLSEKPLDVKKENMLAMIDACKKNNVKLGSIFQRRTFSGTIALKKAIDSGAFGKIALADAYLKYYRDQSYYNSADWRGTWELDGGGTLMNQGIHGIDMISWMMGGIESVYARCERKAWDIEAEDTAVVSVKYKNGAIGVIEGCTSVYPGQESFFSIGGSNGTVTVGDSKFYDWKFKDNPPPMPEISDSMGGINCAYNGWGGHTYQIEDMARAVLDDKQPMITGEEAMKSVEIILAIYESAKTGKEVFL